MYYLWGYFHRSPTRIASVVAILLGLSSPSGVSATEIGLQFLLERATAVRVDATRIAQMVDELNATFARSRVDLEASITYVAVVDLDDDDAVELLAAMHAASGPFATLHQDADIHGADFTVLLFDGLMLRGKTNCGRAYAVNRSPAELADPTRALAVMRPRCGSHTLAHELGHLMGLNHGVQVNVCTQGRGQAHAVTPYANGFAVGNCDGLPQPGEFGTVMVGGWMRTINGERVNRLEIFSNPRVNHPLCGLDQRCGDPTIGDAARALNEHAAIYAAHAEPDVDRLHYADPALARCIARDHAGREIAEVVRLRCNETDLVSLDGLERLVALREVDLAGSAITSLAPLRRQSSRLEKVVLERIATLPCRELDLLQAAAPDTTVDGPGHCTP